MTVVRCAADCGRPLPDDAISPVCPECWDSLERMLGDIPALVEQLNITISRQTATALRNGPRSNEKPLPYNVAASDALGLLHSTLWPWVREGLEASEDAPRSALPDPSTIGLSRWLLGRLGWLQRVEDGANCVTEVRYAIGEARKAIDRAPDMEYAGRCDGDVEGVHCGVEMYAVKGATTVRCRDCGTGRDIAEWRRAAVDLAREREEPIGELMRIVGLDDGTNVTRDQVRGWIRRGRLVRTGNIGPTPTYRVGDVLDIVDEIRRARV